mmetsp:Transcript_111535/g.348851  ORF Transcript_111535/g.348851 Transcript_111535/m.348851 type:complete len:206 (-) Transcript_111535:149-766(-)
MPARSNRPERVHAVQITFQGLGACVCLLFALQGLVILAGPAMGQPDRPLGDFYEEAYWFSEGWLYMVVGLWGFVREVRTCFLSVSASLRQSIGERFVISLGYLWLGAHSLGGRIQQGSAAWRTEARVTAFAAWVVGAVDLLTVCCSVGQLRGEDLGTGGVAKPSKKFVLNGSGGTAAATGGDAGSAASEISLKDGAPVDGRIYAL